MRRKLLYFIFMASVLASCSADSRDEHYGSPAIIIRGSVTDQEGTALEHIRISAASDQTGTITCYSSSDGRFQCSLPLNSRKENIVMTVRIDDIDGQDNNGLYEGKEDTITIFEEELRKTPVTIDLNTYRLNPSTASENIPQS